MKFANLQRVTFTGADDQTDIGEMVRISREYPMVEWGILVASIEHGGRFPSKKWIDEFSGVAGSHQMRVSTHVCGRWVNELLVGELVWRKLPQCLDVSQRVQINTHAGRYVGRYVSTIGLLHNLDSNGDKEFIFQWDGVNNHLVWAPQVYGYKVAALFDESHGAGVAPQSWQFPAKEFWCGYSGGLGPDNVVEEVAKIEKMASTGSRPYWIDMETRVRTDDRFDLDKVRAVLGALEPFLSPETEKG